MFTWLRRLFVSDIDYLSNKIVKLADSFDNVLAVYKGTCVEDYKDKTLTFHFLHKGGYDHKLGCAIGDLELKIAHETNIECSFASYPVSPEDVYLHPHLGKPIYVKGDSKHIKNLFE